MFHYNSQYSELDPFGDSAMAAITNRYTNWNNVHNFAANKDMLCNAYTDFHFVCPTDDLAFTFFANNQSVYAYSFTSRASTHFWPDWFGVTHTDELWFVFGKPLRAGPGFANFTYAERKFARKILKYWSNFVRFDDPNEPIRASSYFNNGATTPTLAQDVEDWPKYRVLADNFLNNKQRAHLVLDSSMIQIGYNLRSDSCAFWPYLIPQLFNIKNN